MNIAKTEKLIEFDKIKELWMSLAMTDASKKQIQEIIPYLSEAELLTKLCETSEGKSMIEKCGNPPVVALNGIMDLLQIAEKGGCLSTEELLSIEAALIAVSRMKQYMKRGTMYQISLAYFEENIQPIDDVREAIATTIVNEIICDNATKLLKSLRMDIATAEEKMKEKAENAIRGNKAYVSDQFTTMRNGHVCIPVKKEYKNKVAGAAIDQSATGNTVFIEPASAAKYFEQLQYLRIDEANEVQRILYELTAMVCEHADTLRENIKIMERLDFIFSKAKLSLELDAVEPRIVQEREIKLVDARHPLMDKSNCVPLQFSIGNGIRGVVITGPNTGGKTVALKTVALNCMMAQCGLHVSCKEASICMHSNFLCDIGDGQNMSENLSTFSAHITNVMDILDEVNEESLVIMDELGSGTDPLEGMGIAVAILEELKESGAFFLVTTHYPEIKGFAEKTDCIVNARMTFDREQLKPLYQMEIGEAGESCAFYIAKRLGMSPKMLNRAAEAAYGQSLKKISEHENDGTGNWKSEHNIKGADENRKDGSKNDRREDETCNRKKNHIPRIIKKKEHKKQKQISFKRGDSIMIYPDKKIGIVCQEANEKGVLQVQMPNKKIWINHKRVKLHVAAEELYPEDYDFSIIFDTVETRKMRHQMERKYLEGEIIVSEE